MLSRRSLVALALMASACGPSPKTTELRNAVATTAARRATQGVAFRFAGRRGADVRLYELPGLDEVSWRFATPGLVAERVVGFAADDDLVYALTPGAELAALDLESGRARTADTLVTAAALAPDGAVLVTRRDSAVAIVRGRRVTPLARLRDEVEGLYGAAGDRLLVVARGDSGRYAAVAAGGAVGERRTLPEGPMAVAPRGDAVAVVTDTGLVVVDLLREGPSRRLRVRGAASAVAFSSSGHRVYVATDEPALMVVDRFDVERLGGMALPAPVRALRADPFGRWLLGQAAEGLVLIPQAGGAPRSVGGEWGDDLPAAGPDGSVLVRRGDDVLVLDGATLEAGARVAGGARDRWLVTEWDPRRPALQLAAAPSDSATRPTPASQVIFVQVSSTSNQQWADDLARDLRLAGMPATVLPPTTPEEMFRVVIGPYATRDAAEETGRKLGRPYWIFTRGGTP